MAQKRIPHRDVSEIVSDMGGTIDRVGSDGQVDFYLDGIPAFAHMTDGSLRISFFIAWDPEPRRAKGFEMCMMAHGEAEIIHVDDGTALRFLVTVPIDAVPDDRGWAREVAAEARELHNDWDGIAQDQDMIALLTAAGLSRPPVGASLADGLRTFGPWHWGTRYVDPMQLYLFYPEVIAKDIVENGHFVAMSHAGHGMNSYGLNLVTGQGPLAVYVQHGYGGAMMQPISAQMDINATYARIATLFDATRSRRDEKCRWLLYLSDFRGAYGILDLESIQASDPVGSAEVDRKFGQLFLAMAEFESYDESGLFSKAAELLGDVAPYNAVD